MSSLLSHRVIDPTINLINETHYSCSKTHRLMRRGTTHLFVILSKLFNSFKLQINE